MTIQERLIKRMNYIGTMNRAQRIFLKDQCQEAGAHFPCGETFLTATPTHVCIICGEHFQLADKT